MALRRAVFLLALMAIAPFHAIAASYELISNQNFTGGSSTNWTYAEIDSGNRASSVFTTTGGNNDAGVWYFELNDNRNNAAYDAEGNLTHGDASWDGTQPSSATAYFSFKQTWTTDAPVSNTIRVFLVKPSGAVSPIFSRSSTANDASYTNQQVSINTANFTTAGTYSLKIVNTVSTGSVPKPVVRNYWDDFSLALVTQDATLNNPTFSNATDLDVGKANAQDNATVSCDATCSGGNCDEFTVGLEGNYSGSWLQLANDANSISNETGAIAFFNCGTASSCSRAWQIEGLSNTTFYLRCFANTTTAGAGSPKTSATSQPMMIFAGTLSTPTQFPSSTQDNSTYDIVQLSGSEDCTGPATANVSCGIVTLSARVNQSSATPNTAISASTNLSLQAGSNNQQGTCWTGASGSCTLSFSAITTNVSYGAIGGFLHNWDLQATSDDSDVASKDGADVLINGSVAQATVTLTSGAFNSDTGQSLGTIQAEISCPAGQYRCVNVSAWARYNATASVDTALPESSGNPAYVPSNSQPSNKTLAAGASDTVSWILTAGSSAGQWLYDAFLNSTIGGFTTQHSSDQTFTISQANVPPQWSQNSTNESTPAQGEAVRHRVFWTDGTELSGFVFSSNYSGSWANDSWQAMDATNWTNVSKSLPVSANTYAWRVYANDSQNAWNATSEQYLEVALRDLSFSVSIPSTGCRVGNGNTSASDIYGCSASASCLCSRCFFNTTATNVYDVPCEGQSDSTSFFSFSNTGNIPEKWVVKIDAALPPAEYYLEGKSCSSPPCDPSSGTTQVTTSDWTVATIAEGASRNFWLWNDFLAVSQNGQMNRSLNHSTSAWDS